MLCQRYFPGSTSTHFAVVSMPNSCTDGTSGSQQCIDLEGEKLLSADALSASTKSSSPHTGEPCDAATLDRTVSFVATCSRSSDGPCHWSDTAGTLYDNTVPSVQILLSRTAALAWPNLQVQVLQPMSNTVQQERHDARCTNVNDTLLDSFGAVDFIDARRKRRASQLFC
jgi:hypothetical protein